MTVEDLRDVISGRLVAVDPDSTLRIVASALCDPRIGLVLVCGRSGRAEGVISKSDVMRHLARAGASDVPVAVLMSRPIISCGTDEDLHDVWQRMAAAGLQNMPVLGAGEAPVGVLDIRDALKALFEREEYEEHLLMNYVTGVGYR